MKYLAVIEASPLFIGVEKLSLRSVSNKSELLDIKATFSDLKLTHEFPSLSKYLQGDKGSFKANRLDKLLEEVPLRDTKKALSQLKDNNPFDSIYDIESIIVQEEDGPGPVEEMEEVVVSQEPQVEEDTVDPWDIIDSLTLRGILNIGEERTALINDSIVKKGESIADMYIVEIQDYKVILMHSDTNFTLKMGVDYEFVKP